MIFPSLVFTPADLLFAAAYAFGISQYVLKGRRRMMIVRTISSGIYILYMVALQAHAGIIACSIAALGSLLQAVFPDHLLAPTLKLRLASAALLAAAGAIFCARTAGDLLPLLAVVNARFTEVQASQQRIRMGLLPSSAFWIAYHWQNGFWLLFCAAVIEVFINLTMIWRHARAHKKTVALAAAVS